MNNKKEIEDFASRLAEAIKVSCGGVIPNNAMQVALKASLDYERLEIVQKDRWQDISEMEGSGNGQILAFFPGENGANEYIVSCTRTFAKVSRATKFQAMPPLPSKPQQEN